MSITPPTSPPPLPSAPPFLSRIWPQLLLPILAAIGLPVTAVAYYLTRYPLLALAIFLLYELGVFIIGFLGKVWGRLEDPLADHIAAWLRQWVITLFSRYHRQYHAYLRYQHRDFDVRGLNTSGTFALELDQVFVELRIDPSTPQKAVVSPVQVPPELYEGSHAIWDYLTSAQLRQQHLVIIGPPGSGKTTLLKHIVLSLVARHRLFHRHQHTRLGEKLPSLLFLRDHAQAIHENEQYSLINAIRDHLAKWDQPLPPEGWFERQLRKGRCLVMLDGLDEVADLETRQQVVRWVERQMSRWNRNRFLVTSRPFGYRGSPLQNAMVLEVRAFTLEQVERFIEKWYLANEVMSKQKNDPGVRMRATSEARALLHRLRATPALFDLTVNPLLLTMIATVHRYGGELPGNRVALYAEICEVFLGKRQLMRGQQMQFTPAQVQSVLEPLAYHMMSANIRDIASDEAQHVIKEALEWVNAHITPEEFLRLVENISGLVLERENDLYSFAHLTFQEFLSASYLAGKQQGRHLAAYVQDSWWRETIRLYCAMEDATPILEACLEGAHPQASAIELAIDCNEEAHKVQPAVRAKLEILLKEGVEDADPERQHVIAEALLARRLHQLVHLKEGTYVDSSLITCAEYQVFLDEQRAKGQYMQPDHWLCDHFQSGQGNAPVLGVRLSDAKAFCDWLRGHENSPWQFRLPEGGELEQEKEMIHSKLPGGVCYWLEDGIGATFVREVVLVPDTLVQESAAFFLSLPITPDISNSQRRIDFISSLEGSSILAKAGDFADVFHPVLITALDLALKRPVVRNPDLVFALDFATALAQSLDLALDLAPDFAMHHLLVFNLARELARDRDHLTSAQASDRALGIALEHYRAQILSLAQVLARTFTITIVPSRTIDIPGTLALALADVITGYLAGTSAPTIARILIRLISVKLFLDKNNGLLKDGHRGGVSARIKKREDELQRLIDYLFVIDIELAVLQKRIEGELPAREGILIVKEWVDYTHQLDNMP